MQFLMVNCGYRDVHVCMKTIKIWFRYSYNEKGSRKGVSQNTHKEATILLHC